LISALVSIAFRCFDKEECDIWFDGFMKKLVNLTANDSEKMLNVLHALNSTKLFKD
jgi:hypothetical protein